MRYLIGWFLYANIRLNGRLKTQVSVVSRGTVLPFSLLARWQVLWHKRAHDFHYFVDDTT